MDGSSDWTGRGSQSRGSSTISTSSEAQLDELRNMTESLKVGVQNSNILADVMRKEQATTASMTAEVVNTFAEEMKRAQAATASAITAMGL